MAKAYYAATLGGYYGIVVSYHKTLFQAAVASQDTSWQDGELDNLYCETDVYPGKKTYTLMSSCYDHGQYVGEEWDSCSLIETRTKFRSILDEYKGCVDEWKEAWDQLKSTGCYYDDVSRYTFYLVCHGYKEALKAEDVDETIALEVLEDCTGEFEMDSEENIKVFKTSENVSEALRILLYHSDISELAALGDMLLRKAEEGRDAMLADWATAFMACDGRHDVGTMLHCVRLAMDLGMPLDQTWFMSKFIFQLTSVELANEIAAKVKDYGIPLDGETIVSAAVNNAGGSHR